jgi:hypothetical protein
MRPVKRAVSRTTRDVLQGRRAHVSAFVLTHSPVPALQDDPAIRNLISRNEINICIVSLRFSFFWQNLPFIGPDTDKELRP